MSNFKIKGVNKNKTKTKLFFREGSSPKNHLSSDTVYKSLFQGI
jgi:hypothetical protein